MGLDQVEGIVRSNLQRPPPSCHCNGACGLPMPKRSCVLSSSEVRFQRVKCECHCITCACAAAPSSTSTSNRSLDDGALGRYGVSLEDSTVDESEGHPSAQIRREPSTSTVDMSTSNIQRCPYSSTTAVPPASDLSVSFPTVALPDEECLRLPSTGPTARYGHSFTEFFPGHFLLFGGTDATKYFNDMFILIRGAAYGSRSSRNSSFGSAAVGPMSSSPSGAYSKSGDSRSATPTMYSPDGDDSPHVIAIQHAQPKPSSWTELRPLTNAPSPRFGHSCHLHYTNDRLIFFGGSNNDDSFNDMYYLDLMPQGMSRTFVRVAAEEGSLIPCPRRGHTLVPDDTCHDGRCVLFGGIGPTSLQDVWLLDANLQWKEAQTTGSNPCPWTGSPESRYGHTAVVYRGKMYVFGGFCAAGAATNSVWELDLLTMVWTEVNTTVGSTVPCSRFGHSASLIGPRMIIFGGMDNFPGGKVLNDAYQLHLDTLEWSALQAADDTTEQHEHSTSQASASQAASHDGLPALSTSDVTRMTPLPRRSHAAALDRSGSRPTVVIFGGWCDGETLSSDDCCMEMQVAAPSLREIARNWIGSRLVYPRQSGAQRPGVEM